MSDLEICDTVVIGSGEGGKYLAGRGEKVAVCGLAMVQAKYLSAFSVRRNSEIPTVKTGTEAINIKRIPIESGLPGAVAVISGMSCAITGN